MLGVVPVSTTAMVVVFDRPVSYLDPGAWYSGGNPANYALFANPAPLPPWLPATRQPLVGVVTVDADYRTQVVLEPDVALEPLTRVTLSLSGVIQGEAGEGFAGPQDWTVTALLDAPGPVTPLEVRVDQYSDVDYVVTGPPGVTTQVYTFQANNDLAHQAGDVSLRKRIYRRLFGSPGEYAWAPSYGVGVRVKALARGGRLQELASLVADQVRQEPDVADASAEVTVNRAETGTTVSIALAVIRDSQRVFRTTFVSPV